MLCCRRRARAMRPAYPLKMNASTQTESHPHQVRPGPGFYVIWSTPSANNDLLGVHYGEWRDVVKIFPHQRFEDTSMIKDAKRFENQEAAVSYYLRRRERRERDNVPLFYH